MYKLLASITLLMILSCGQKEVKIPSHIIPEDKMVEVIKDIQLLEAAHKDMGLFGLEKQNVIDTSYVIIFNKHEIKASEFDSSHNFYTQYPKLYEQLMDKVEHELSKEQ